MLRYTIYLAKARTKSSSQVELATYISLVDSWIMHINNAVALL